MSLDFQLPPCQYAGFMADAPISVPRLLVDQFLEAENTTFEVWVDDQRQIGLSIDAMHRRLIEESGSDFSVRTFYRWLDDLDIILDKGSA